MSMKLIPSDKVIVHLTASPFLGGPERQMLGLARALPENYQTVFLCLMEGGKSQPFVDEIRRREGNVICLRHNHPHLVASVREVIGHLRRLRPDAVFTHNYKPLLIGHMASCWVDVPVVAVSRGWTAATRKVRLYEAMDRRVLQRVDRVVCVSNGQANKVRCAGVPDERVTVIPNSIDVSRFGQVAPEAGEMLRSLFPQPLAHIVMAVGRLSPEKGFSRLIEAAALVCRQRPDVGFALVGDGPLRDELSAQVQHLGLGDRFVFCGFRDDVDTLLPHAMCLAQSSFTEGMPNVVLEAMAASIPVVATEVGGTPELVVDGQTGWLVPPDDAETLARRVLDMVASDHLRQLMGAAGRRRVVEHFTFASQAAQYMRLIQEVARGPGSVMPVVDPNLMKIEQS